MQSFSNSLARTIFSVIKPVIELVSLFEPDHASDSAELNFDRIVASARWSVHQSGITCIKRSSQGLPNLLNCQHFHSRITTKDYQNESTAYLRVSNAAVQLHSGRWFRRFRTRYVFHCSYIVIVTIVTYFGYNLISILHTDLCTLKVMISPNHRNLLLQLIDSFKRDSLNEHLESIRMEVNLHLTPIPTDVNQFLSA